MRRALGRLSRFVARQRHKRGFGIHSPFGFYFITRILNEGNYGYYCYPALNRAAREGGIRPRRLRMVMRVANYLAGPVVLAPGASEAEVTALLASDSRRQIVENAEEYLGLCRERGINPFVYIGTPEKIAEVTKITEMMAKGGTLIVNQTDTPAGQLLASITEPLGMTFSGRDMSIVVARRGLPRQKFAVAL